VAPLLPRYIVRRAASLRKTHSKSVEGEKRNEIRSKRQTVRRCCCWKRFIKMICADLHRQIYNLGLLRTGMERFFRAELRWYREFKKYCKMQSTKMSTKSPGPCSYDNLLWMSPSYYLQHLEMQRNLFINHHQVGLLSPSFATHHRFQ